MFNKKELIEKKETLLEKLQKAKEEHGISYLSVFNNGNKWDDTIDKKLVIKYANEKDEFDLIGETLFYATEQYSKVSDFDTVKLNIVLGLMYEGKDTDIGKTVKEDAQPIEGIVRFYTEKASCYLNGEVSNNCDYGYHSHAGYIAYENLINGAKENGLIFNGPKTFEEFKEYILLGEPFEISISANLNTNNKDKEQQQVKTK